LRPRKPHSTTARRFIGPLVILLLAGIAFGLAADPAVYAPFAMGGLEFKKEPRISMQSENLLLAGEDVDGQGFVVTVTVDYDFVNVTDRDVSVLMGFPVPDELCGALNSSYAIFASLDTKPLHVWVQGRKINYATEARAFRTSQSVPPANEDLSHDYTPLLAKFGLAPGECGNYADLPEAARTTLASAGLLDDQFNASWTVRRRYYWSEVFPARRSSHIKISYRALEGADYLFFGKPSDPSEKQMVEESAPLWPKEVQQTCADSQVQQAVASKMSGPASDGGVLVTWVDFILLTANYWNGPIKNFALTVKVPKPGPHVDFCWDGPVTRPDAQTDVVTVHDFSPKRDLHIAFFNF
jgi:hypothetical protein